MNAQNLISFFGERRKSNSFSTTNKVRYLTLLFLSIAFTFLSFNVKAQPSVWTDRLDYFPGEIAYTFGTGWTPNSTVTLTVHEEPYTHPDIVISVTADGSGNFSQVKIYEFDLTDYGHTFTLTATEGTNQAISVFTDAEGSTNKVYQHWADAGGPEWNNNILNDAKSNYFEGEVIPHVFVWKASNQTPLTNGQSYSFNVTYNYYQQNTNAGGFAYMTTLAYCQLLIQPINNLLPSSSGISDHVTPA